MGLRSGIKVRASRLDEKSLNYGQLNAALVGAVKSLKSQDSGARWRVGDKGKMDCAWRMETKMAGKSDGAVNF